MTDWLTAIASSLEWSDVGFVLYWMSGVPFVLIAPWRAVRAPSRLAASMQQIGLSVTGTLAIIGATWPFGYLPPGGWRLSVGASLVIFLIGLFVALLRSNEPQER